MMASKEEEVTEISEVEEELAQKLKLQSDKACKSKQESWEREQSELKSRLVVEDSPEVLSWRRGKELLAGLSVVAGVDISFVKESPKLACAMLVVLNFPELEVQYESKQFVTLTEPYVPGFLAFREVQFLLERLEEVKAKRPNLIPQVILVDGNGTLHPRGFGLASHLGVLSGIPCVGVGKKLYHVDGLEKSPEYKDKINKVLLKGGDTLELVGNSGRVWGKAVRMTDDAPNPVYVSVGHKISLDTAVKLAVACSRKRVPEPIRQADILSRETIRRMDTTLTKASSPHSIPELSS